MKKLQSKPSIPDFNKYQTTNETTIAEYNKVSFKPIKNFYQCTSPIRAKLPEYFNLPAFKDIQLPFFHKQNNNISLKEDIVFKKRMKDLSLLAEGMKRAKNIKEESRYYFTEGVLLHNACQYIKSIDCFEKFLKIVIYLQDTKSVELALNVLGCAYMYLEDFESNFVIILEAEEFHKKQSEVSDRSDLFISCMNLGMCEELKGNNKQAYIKYCEALELCEQNKEHEDRSERMEVTSNLIERVEFKAKEDDLFLTQNTPTKITPIKNIQSSFIKEESSLLMKNTSNRKEYENAKLKFAISTAEESIEEHLKCFNC